MIAPIPSEQATRFLIDWSNGNREAAAGLMPLVYEELRGLARGYLQRERADHTLQATALVHEAYLRLVDQKTTTWRNPTPNTPGSWSCGFLADSKPRKWPRFSTCPNEPSNANGEWREPGCV